jgi:hypothetical protein
MTAAWVLVIILIAGPSGGRSIDTSLVFSAPDQCEAARKQLDAAHNTLAERFAQTPPLMACIRTTMR